MDLIIRLTQELSHWHIWIRWGEEIFGEIYPKRKQLVDVETRGPARHSILIDSKTLFLFSKVGVLCVSWVTSTSVCNLEKETEIGTPQSDRYSWWWNTRVKSKKFCNFLNLFFFAKLISFHYLTKQRTYAMCSR